MLTPLFIFATKQKFFYCLHSFIILKYETSQKKWWNLKIYWYFCLLLLFIF